MPYKMFSVGSKWQVWKVDADGNKVEKKGPAYPSKSQARKYMNALWAAEDKSKENDMSDNYIIEATKNASDFLVVEDPKKPATFHLQVKKNGKPDRALAGAAWAALFSVGGHRGNKYEGPDAAKAKSKLKALYKAEGWPMPTEKSSENDIDTAADLSEYYGMSRDYIDSAPSYRNGVPYGARTFADVDEADKAAELMERLNKRNGQFYVFFWDIWNDAEIPVSEKAAEWTRLFTDFIQAFNAEISQEKAEIEELDSLTENLTGSIIKISENGKFDAENRQPLKMDIVIIEPGFGNAADNHYYPKDVIRRDAAKVFEGAKMYATDHRPEEKSVRTEVGKIERVIQFSETGAPIARVKIWDADFAEDIRNRAKMNELSTLECSILARGKAKKGKIDGRDTNIVEAIIPSKYTNVDFVTTAGAGGRALHLVENEKEVVMPEKNEDLETQAAAETEPVQETEDVTLHENEDEIPEEAEQAETNETVTEAEQAEPTYLAEAAVSEVLSKAKLPEISRDRLAKVVYFSEADLQSAITAEKEYVKTLIRSGEVMGLGDSEPANNTLTFKEIQKDHQKRIDAILFE